MSYKAGTFPGTVTDYGITPTKEGLPSAFVKFDVHFSAEETRPMTWFGSFKGGAFEHTLKALTILGCANPDDLPKGIEGGSISIGTKVNLVIAEEPTENGGTRHRVQWINKLGGGMEIKRMDSGTAAVQLKKLNLAGELARFKAANPNLAPSQDDVPFD